ncbi:MAG: hypothetical protein KGK10_07235 [Rhodospirillales bacterium]|nr:hypothetical protein [Rhodospirillales bacterium]
MRQPAPAEGAPQHTAGTRQASRRQARNRLFGLLLALVSLGMFAIVVALVIAFHAYEAYRVIPGF